MSSAPAGVADSDPGEDCGRGEMKREGLPKLADAAASEPVTLQGNLVGTAGEADVFMVEATEEEVAAVAGVKVEGKVVVAGDVTMTDAAPEGGAGKVSDSLYATESASMDGAEGYGDESAENMQALNGGDDREGILGVEAGGSQSEAERKPAQVEPITAETVEVSDSTTSQYPEAEFNRGDQRARYHLPPLDKHGFRVSSLVWSKLKGHPWWPGEIFDPSNASELALKNQKKGNHLVAYCGDATFAWCDESQLKPFMTNYSQMEKQSSSDAFINAVNHALEELSRRILSGMSCSCLPEGLSDNGMSYMVENSGLRDGVTCSTVKQGEILEYFSPENLLHYVKSLALSPGQGGDLLDLVIACSQLTSFYRSKGCPELASFQTGSAWVDNGMDTSPTKNVMLGEAVTVEVQPSHDKSKRGRGRPRKQKPEDYLELMDKKAASNLSNDTAYDDPVERQMVMDFDDFNDLQNKKKRSLDSFEDSETKSSTTTFGSSFKIGECIRRAASHLTASSSIVKFQNEPTVYKNTAEAENGEFDISSDDAINELTVEKRAKRRRMHRHHIADPKALLSQLCSVAMEPMNGYSFSAMIISYFSDYRNYIVSTTTEANIIEKSTAKRGGKRKVLPSDVETTDHIQDTYWSGLSLLNHPIHSLRGASMNSRPRRRRRASQDTNLLSVQHLQLGTLGPKKQIQVIERSIIHVDEKLVDEYKPTALVLSFGRSAALPSETDLIKMFGRYGPLKESETEVHKNTNTVKIVFKKRADAERAFSAAGKYVAFGPSLRSYRLVNMPFSLGLSAVNNPVEHPEDHGLEVPGPRESDVPVDAMQVDQVDKSDKGEAVKESSAEQVETVKQSCQAEAADKALVDQVDMVEKTGQIDAELTGLPGQVGTDAHHGQAETIAEESSKQVSTIELAYTQYEASLKDRLDIALSVAANGASNGGTVDEIHLGNAPNQASVEVPSNTLQMEAASEAQTEDTIKQTSHAEATNGESAEVLSGTIQVDVVAEAPKQGHVCGDNAVFEAIAESSIIADVDTVEQTVQEASAEVPASTMEAVTVPEALQGVHVLRDAVHFEVQTEEVAQVVGVIEQAREEPLNEASKDVTENEVPEETSVSLELQAQSFTEKPGEQDATDQTMQFQAPQEESVEIPSDAKLEVEAVTAEQVGQVATEQVKVPVEESTTVLSDVVPAETSEVQEQSETVQFEPVCETSVEQEGTNVEADTVEDLTKASAQETGSNKQIMESETAAEVSVKQVCSVERTVQVEAVTEASGGEIEVGKQIAEDVAMADATTTHSVMVKGAVESKVEAPVDETVENKAAAETLAGETAEGKITAEAQDEKLENKATAEALSDVPDENEETNNKVTAEALAGETAEGETTAEALVEETTTAEKTIEDTTVEAPDEITTTAEKTVDDATVEARAPDEKTATAEKVVEDATVEAPDEITTAAGKDARLRH